MICESPRYEEAVLFGEYEHLVGTWKPSESNECSDTAVIFLNAGILHQSGPFRLHVNVAEALARRSISSFRFDLSGIGESLAVGSARRSIDRAALEVSAAIDWLTENASIKQAILFGLCSGADDAFHAAISDERVSGVIAMDGCGFRTKQYFLHRLTGHCLPRIARTDKWIRMALRLIQSDRWRSNASEQQPIRWGNDIREFPERDEAESQLLSLAERGVAQHFIYTGGVSEYYNYAGQFEDMFPSLAQQDLVSHAYFPQWDHVAFLCEDRRQLVQHVTDKATEMLHSIETHRDIESLRSNQSLCESV